MRINSWLLIGLSDEQKKQLESELKHSIFVKRLKKFLQDELEDSYRADEVSEDTVFSYAKEAGKRRGYRNVLNLIPEE